MGYELVTRKKQKKYKLWLINYNHIKLTLGRQSNKEPFQEDIIDAMVTSLGY